MTYKTNREIATEYQGYSVTIPEGTECNLVSGLTYCTNRKKRVDGYVVARPTECGANAHDANHYYLQVPDDAVDGRLADAALVRKALREDGKGEWRDNADEWRVDIGGQLFAFYMGLGHRDKKTGRPNRPKHDDVMHALVSDADACDMSFEDWCADFGYDPDSRKALQTYLTCQETTAKLRKAGVDIAAERERLQDY